MRAPLCVSTYIWWRAPHSTCLNEEKKPSCAFLHFPPKAPHIGFFQHNTVSRPGQASSSLLPSLLSALSFLLIKNFSFHFFNAVHSFFFKFSKYYYSDDALCLKPLFCLGSVTKKTAFDSVWLILRQTEVTAVAFKGSPWRPVSSQEPVKGTSESHRPTDFAQSNSINRVSR